MLNDPTHHIKMMLHHFAQLVEEQALWRTMGSLLPDDSDWFAHEIEYAERSIHYLLGALKKEVGARPPGYWLNRCRRKIQKLRHNMQDKSLQGTLTYKTKCWFKKAIRFEENTIHEILQAGKNKTSK